MNNNQPRSIFPGEVFARTADFDKGIRQLIPKYDEMLDTVVVCLPARVERILELGCGTGELSLKLLERFSTAEILAVDYSPRMIEWAESKIKSAGYGDRWKSSELDFGDWANNREVDPVGKGYDACVSSLAIHHLSNEMKEKLFKKIKNSLKPEGVFWNADPIALESPQLTEIYQTVREDWTTKQGATLAQVRAKIGTSNDYGYSSHDQLATMEEHLQMLQTAGFVSVAVPWKYYGLAVIGGWIDRS
ncbi:class I SAM-dependent methyltransferase [Pleurocapsales cyanobacterium LEGE 06147]|nr:class I SAM-dependent methyltransferase [Pleurocapsales cyanobacterium LEGE 06147]